MRHLRDQILDWIKFNTVSISYPASSVTLRLHNSNKTNPKSDRKILQKYLIQEVQGAQWLWLSSVIIFFLLRSQPLSRGAPTGWTQDSPTKSFQRLSQPSTSLMRFSYHLQLCIFIGTKMKKKREIILFSHNVHNKQDFPDIPLLFLSLWGIFKLQDA